MKNILYIIFLLFSLSSHADNINQRNDLSPRAKLKVNKHLAKSFVDKEDKTNENDKVNIEKNGTREEKGSQTINSFNNVKDAPDEVITVVDGDIINICFHCR